MNFTTGEATNSFSFWQERGRGSDLECDIAVVGAGIVGASAAYWISRLRPDRHVVLIDGRAVAAGASGRNAGFLLQGVRSDYVKDCEAFGADRARQIWRFTRENRDLIFGELDHKAIELESSGGMVVAGSHKEDGRLQESVRLMRADGAASVYFGPRETNKRLSSRGFYGSLYVPSAAMLNPVALVRHVVECSGAQVVDHAPVRAIESRATGVYVDSGRRGIRADRLVLAVNAWTSNLLPQLKQFVRPVRAQMLSTKPLDRRWLDVPVYSHDGYYFVRQTRDGSLLAGGARHLHQASEVGFEETPTEVVQRDIEAFIAAHFPKADRMAIASRWAGIMGFSPDGVPVVGDLPDVPGSIWAGGFTGHGMGYGFRFGRMLAQIVLGDERPDGYDLFTDARFDPGGERAAAS